MVFMIMSSARIAGEPRIVSPTGVLAVEHGRRKPLSRGTSPAVRSEDGMSWMGNSAPQRLQSGASGCNAAAPGEWLRPQERSVGEPTSTTVRVDGLRTRPAPPTDRDRTLAGSIPPAVLLSVTVAAAYVAAAVVGFRLAFVAGRSRPEWRRR